MQGSNRCARLKAVKRNCSRNSSPVYLLLFTRSISPLWCGGYAPRLTLCIAAFSPQHAPARKDQATPVLALCDSFIWPFTVLEQRTSAVRHEHVGRQSAKQPDRASTVRSGECAAPVLSHRNSEHEESKRVPLRHHSLIAHNSRREQQHELWPHETVSCWEAARKHVSPVRFHLNVRD
jgi:hypothetical protein